MKKLSKKAFKPIDQEEKDLMESIERDEWQPVENINHEKKKAIAAARNTFPFFAVFFQYTDITAMIKAAEMR